ncbi:MAG: hypothetical protein AAFP77_30655 [Bacteroidota bacterium]
MKSPDFLIPQSWSKCWIILMALAFAPLFSFSQSTTSTETHHVRLSEDTDNSRRKLQWRRNGNSFNVEYEGYITLSDDDRDIIAISAGGYIKISKSAFGSKRRINIEADRNGNLIRKYYEGWSQKDFEPNGRAWLAEVLPEIVRSSTIGAEDRVNRIYGNGGMNAFTVEVRELESDYVKAAYIKLVLCKDLNDQEVDQLMGVMGSEVKSDYYLASLLQDNYVLFLQNPQRVSAFVDAARSISSDHYMTEVLGRVVTSDQATETQIPTILDAANNIQSDHYLSSLLIDLMNDRELSSATLVSMLRVSENIQSDHYMSEVLQRAARQDNLSGTAYEGFLSALAKIDSDHYTKEVIFAIDKEDFSSTTLVNMLDQLRQNVQSDHYLNEALRHIIREQSLDGPTYTALLRAAASIQSDNYSSGVYEALVRDKNLSGDQLAELLLSTGNIQSDHYLTEVLLAVAPLVKNQGEEVKSAYRTAAKEISSESYYGRAVRAID